MSEKNQQVRDVKAYMAQHGKLALVTVGATELGKLRTGHPLFVCVTGKVVLTDAYLRKCRLFEEDALKDPAKNHIEPSQVDESKTYYAQVGNRKIARGLMVEPLRL